MPELEELPRDDEDRAVIAALASTYVPAPIQEARDEQDAVLRERFEGGALRIADVGCGNGYHGSIFAPSAVLYHGFEISEEIAATARDRWRQQGLDNATVFVTDVSRAELDDEFYDLVFCLYFTPGNFRDRSQDLGLYTDDYLDRNPVFIAVFSRFYRALKSGGAMFLTVYKDVPEAEAAQIDFYTKTGQHVMTPPGSRFVMTAENFWSARWTRESLSSNLEACGIDRRQVELHDLNAIAWLVEITK